MVDLHTPCDYVLICVSGTGSASALSYGASVENDRSNGSVFQSLSQRSVLLNTDPKLVNVGLKREVHGEIPLSP